MGQKVVFKSGTSIGAGLTYELNKETVDNITYCDTPGLNDAKKREAAGKAITKALKEGGETKILFFVGQESGRPKQDDVTTMNLVLKATPEIGNKFGVILPKINKKMAKKLVDRSKTPDPWTEFLAGLFAGLEVLTDLKDPEESEPVDYNLECLVANVQGVQIHESLEEEDNKLVEKGELKTLENHPLENFVFDVLPSINLTPEAAADIDTASFEQKQSEIVKLIERSTANEEKMKSLQEQVEKARDEAGPLQMMLGGVGKLGDKYAGAPLRLIEGLITKSLKT